MTIRTLHFSHSDLFTNNDDIPDALYARFEYRLNGGSVVPLAIPPDPDHNYEAVFDDVSLPLGNNTVEVRLVLTDGRTTSWIAANFEKADERVPTDPFNVSVS